MSKVKVKYYNDSCYQDIFDNEGNWIGMTDEYYYAKFDTEEEYEKWKKQEYEDQEYTGFGIAEVMYE